MSATLLARFLLPAALSFGVGPEPVDARPEEQASPAPDGAAASETKKENQRAGPNATHVVLPCGLRVIAARDDSLPVAAVVLAVETGTENDPKDSPGLIHALAFHLQQGNREMAPGQTFATAHDTGGFSTMAIGHAQVRYETLVPVSQLDRVLWNESQRLRAPTVNETLWLKTLNYARSDRRPKYPVPTDVMAAAWQREGLAHNGHKVPKALTRMTPEEISNALAKTFEYRRSTLVVVAPRDPAEIIERVAALFEDLPDAPRDARPSTVPAANESGPRTAPAARQRGDTLIWPVRAAPGAKAWAEVVCATLNRQRRGPDDGAKSRLRCTFVDDARRPVLAVRIAGAEPAVLAGSRLKRILDGDDDRILSAQRDRFARRLRHQFHQPLPLARRLALGDASESTPKLTQVGLDTLTGLAALDDLRGAPRYVESLFDPAFATLLVPGPDPDDEKPEKKSDKKSDKKSKETSDEKPEEASRP